MKEKPQPLTPRQQTDCVNYFQEMLLLTSLIKRRSKFTIEHYNLPKELSREVSKITSTSQMAINTMMRSFNQTARDEYNKQITEEKLAAIGNIMRILQLCDEEVVLQVENALINNGKMVESANVVV